MISQDSVFVCLLKDHRLGCAERSTVASTLDVRHVIPIEGDHPDFVFASPLGAPFRVEPDQRTEQPADLTVIGKPKAEGKAQRVLHDLALADAVTFVSGVSGGQTMRSRSVTSPSRRSSSSST